MSIVPDRLVSRLVRVGTLADYRKRGVRQYELYLSLRGRHLSRCTPVPVFWDWLIDRGYTVPMYGLATIPVGDGLKHLAES